MGLERGYFEQWAQRSIAGGAWESDSTVAEVLLRRGLGHRPSYRAVSA